jgi:hypothetical protein
MKELELGNYQRNFRIRRKILTEEETLDLSKLFLAFLLSPKIFGLFSFKKKMSQKGVDKATKIVAELFTETWTGSGEDPRPAQCAGTCENLPTLKEEQAFLEQVISGLQRIKDKQASKKKGSLSFLEEGLDVGDDDDDDGDDDDGVKAIKAATDGKKAILHQENKLEAHKKMLASNFMKLFGGCGRWKISADITKFVHSTSLPKTFSSRLTALANESSVCAKGYEVLCGGTVSEKELQALGELVFSEMAAKTMVLYAAWHKGTVEGAQWTEETLDKNIDKQTKNMIGLALRSVGGVALDKAAASVGDIFGNAKDDDDEKQTVKMTKTVISDRKRSRAEDEVQKDWWVKKPEGMASSERCKKCNGWGHNGSCVPDKGFEKYCSKCHGKGHKQASCPSKR